MTRSLLAGIDIGTTSTKALLITSEGQDVAIGRAPTPWTATSTGTESSGPRLADAAKAALADALRQCPDDRVGAVGVASIGESGVLTDNDDSPVAPVIAWHDHRDEAQLADLTARVGGATFSATTGLPTWTQWTLTKHRWLVDHDPDVAAARRRYSVAEWVVRSLGGERASELSLAARTGWLDLHTTTWWPPTLEWSGASPSLFADLVGAGTPLGRARAGGELAAADGAVLTIAGHDHQAAAVGVGCHRIGDEFDSCGTAEALLRTVAPGLSPETILELTSRGVTVGWHVVAERWCLLGATQGGRILGKVLSALGTSRDGLADLDSAALRAAGVDAAVTLGPGAGDVTVDPGASPGEVWHAATRGVSLQAAALSEALSRAGGPRRRLFVAGGWTNSTAFMAAKAATVGPAQRVTTPEAGCRGAAVLAGVAAGVYADLDEAPVASTSP